MKGPYAFANDNLSRNLSNWIVTEDIWQISLKQKDTERYLSIVLVHAQLFLKPVILSFDLFMKIFLFHSFCFSTC